MAVEEHTDAPREGADGELQGADQPRTAVVIVAVLGVLLALLVGVLATRPSSGDRVADSKLIGRIAPAIEGEQIDGGTFDMASYRGRWIVVNFFATWCTPCIVEHPELVAFEEAHAEAGDAAVVSVVFDDEVEDALAFFEDRGGTWPVLRDDDGAIRVAYGVAQVPESFIVAPDGTVVERLVGGVTAAQMDSILDAYEAAAAEGASS